MTLFHDDYYYYTLDNNEVVFGNKNRADYCFNPVYGSVSLKTLTIPSYATYQGKQYAVKRMYHNCFCGGNEIEKVIIPKTLELLGANAFHTCSNLKEVVFEAESRLSVIEYKSFYSCKSLEKITIPPSVTSIQYDTFILSGLKEIYYCGKHYISTTTLFDSNNNLKIYTVIGIYPKFFFGGRRVLFMSICSVDESIKGDIKTCKLKYAFSFGNIFISTILLSP